MQNSTVLVRTAPIPAPAAPTFADPVEFCMPRSGTLQGEGAETGRAATMRTRRRESAASPHSHSMVPGGFDVTSSTTRLTSRTSFVMRLEMRASTS